MRLLRYELYVIRFERQERQKDRETERQQDRKTERQRDMKCDYM